MDIQELMIGDWVHHGSVVIQVEDILEGGINTEWCQGECEVIDGDHLKPIPLTKNMLEKNGFKDGCYKTKSVGGADIEVCLSKDIPMYSYGKPWHYCLPHPQYVHELQHALRMLGLCELANTFRVGKV